MDFLGSEPLELVQRLVGIERGMRAQQDSGVMRQWGVRGQRFGFEDVERGREDDAVVEGVDQRRLVDQRAAGGVDQYRMRLHQRQPFGIDRVVGRRRGRCVQAQPVATGQQLFQGGNDVDPVRGECFDVRGGGMSNDATTEGSQPICDGAGDASAAE